MRPWLSYNGDAMSDLRKAAEMMAYEVPLHELLEGVPENARLVIDSEDGMGTRFIPIGHYCKRASAALRQALAQPEQEPVAWIDTKEPRSDEAFRFQQTEHHTQPLYTAPPKRKWVGLEDENLDDVTDEFFKGAVWAEAKLKEKNT